ADAVAVAVHVRDVLTHLPVEGASVWALEEQTVQAARVTSLAGAAQLSLSLRHSAQPPLLLLLVKGSGYVPSTLQWQIINVPLAATLNVHLLPEDPAQLTVYRDLVTVSSRVRGHKWHSAAQLHPGSLVLPRNTSYSDLEAYLTVSTTADELDLFPFPLGTEVNATGEQRTLQFLDVLGTSSSHLLSKHGSRESNVTVAGPVQLSLALPPGASLRDGDTGVVWELDSSIGVWRKTGLAQIKLSGDTLLWMYMAFSSGCWLLASPDRTAIIATSDTKSDMPSYHTILLLAILGGVLLIILFLLCLVMYYCRRKRSRERLRKLPLSSPADTLPLSRREQGTSTSYANLGAISTATSSREEAGMSSQMLKLCSSSAAASPEFDFSIGDHGDTFLGSADTLPVKMGCTLRGADGWSESLQLLGSASDVLLENLSSARACRSLAEDSNRSVRSAPVATENIAMTSVLIATAASHRSLLADDDAASDSRQTSGNLAATPLAHSADDLLMDRKVPECFLTRSVDHLGILGSPSRPGQLFLFGSVSHVNDKINGKMVQTLVIPSQCVTLPTDHPLLCANGAISSEQPSWVSNNNQTQAADAYGVQGWEPRHLDMPTNGLEVPVATAMNGELQPVPHGTAALLELKEVKPLKHPKAWFVALDGSVNAQVRHSYIDLRNDASLDSGLNLSEGKKGRRKAVPVASRLADNGKSAGRRQEEGKREGTQSAVEAPPSYTQLVFLDEMDQNSGSESGTATCSPEEGSLRPLLGTEASAADAAYVLTSSIDTESPADVDMNTSQSEEPDGDDGGEGGDGTKSRWQKREERPLIAFNLQ
uniref:Family with sequence similarity 171 member A2a n=1 Tax=Petromyzon marinus TaxID=7757 RepID=S4RWK0_PETMA